MTVVVYRRCCDGTTPLRRQHARARLEQRQQRPVIDVRQRRSVGRFLHDDDDEIQSTSIISLHATRGSLPDLSDLSSDSELYVDERPRSRCDRRLRQRRCVAPSTGGAFVLQVQCPPSIFFLPLHNRSLQYHLVCVSLACFGRRY